MSRNTGNKSGGNKNKKAATKVAKKRGRKMEDYRPATYPAARRVARLVAEYFEDRDSGTSSISKDTLLLVCAEPCTV